jgi:sugar phosphate isomerase/epimerase
MIDYLSKTMEVCRDLGGEILVFGSPRNRNKENIAEHKAYSIAVEFFSIMGRIAQENDVCFCIEPLGRTETNFINTVKDAERLIKDVGNSGLGLHIDAKGLIDAKEYDAPYLIDSFSNAKHFHVNDSNLKPPGSTGFDHSLISSKLQRSEYSQYISIEMRRIDDDVVGVIKSAVEYVNKTYF